jgi:hypothetical protein
MEIGELDDIDDIAAESPPVAEVPSWINEII